MAYTNNNVQLAGIPDQSSWRWYGMCQCREDPSCCTSRGLHSTTNDRDKCKIRLKLNMIRIYGFMDSQARIFCSFSSKASLWTKIVMVSIPDGICSMETPLSSNTWRTFLQKPISEFIIAFSIVIAAKPSVPAIPVIVYFGWQQVASTIRVPLSCGAFVFLMFDGIPAFLTGKIASFVEYCWLPCRKAHEVLYMWWFR